MSKFAQEAWIIVLLIPLLVAVFLQIRTHYREVAEQLSLNRSIIGPLLDFLDEMDAQQDDGQLAVVVLPEFVPAKCWQSLLHNQTAWLIKAAFLYRRRHLGFERVVIDVP